MTPTVLLLSAEERQRFMEYLAREALSARAMAEQLRKIGRPGEMLAQQEQRYADAAELIAERLRKTESFTVGGPTHG